MTRAEETQERVVGGEQATAERLIAEGRMMEPGLAALERA